jgi:hypothetical protein
MSDLAGQLVNPSTGSPAAEWTPPVRVAAIQQIAAALTKGSAAVVAVAQAGEPVANANADPAVALDLLNDVTYVNTLVLASGDLLNAVTFFRDPQNLVAVLNKFGTLFPQMPESNLALYRDYLRGV